MNTESPTSSRTETKRKVFVISPIGEDGSDVRERANLLLDYIIKPALPENYFEIKRSDMFESPYAITARILQEIIDADICIVDLTGLNANVMYELALAQAADKRVILMASDRDKPPFDIQDLRLLRYGTRIDQANRASEYLKSYVDQAPTDLETILNPVKQAFTELTRRKEIEATGDSSEKALAETVEALSKKIDTLQGQSYDTAISWQDNQSLSGSIHAPGKKELADDLTRSIKNLHALPSTPATDKLLSQAHDMRDRILDGPYRNPSYADRERVTQIVEETTALHQQRATRSE